MYNEFQLRQKFWRRVVVIPETRLKTDIPLKTLPVGRAAHC